MINTWYQKLAKPAQRSLQTFKIERIEDFSKHTRKMIVELHGIGPKAMKIIEEEMKSKNIQFYDIEKDIKELQKPGIKLVDQYIKKFPLPIQSKLKEMRQIIKEAASEASEKISYQMPAFYYWGNLVYFAGYTNHIGFYPTASGINKYEKELSRYKHAKGSIQFPIDEPLPKKLIKEIVQFRVKENKEKTKERKLKKRI